MADYKQYEGVKRADLDKIRRELSKRGIAIPDGDDVEVKGPFGVRLQVTFDEPRENLKLAITDKPFFVTEKQIWKVVEMGAGKVGRG